MGGSAGGRVLTQPAIGIPCSVGSDREFGSYFRARDALPSVMTGFKADVIRKRCPAPQTDLPNSLRRHLLDRCQTYLVENLHMSAWTSEAMAWLLSDLRRQAAVAGQGSQDATPRG